MTTATAAERSAPSTESLVPRPDQLEQWHAFSKPVPFDVAATRILDAHRTDGERDDVVATDLRAWAFGSTDSRTMQLVRVPFAGREVGEPMALREQAFSQLCSRFGAPAPYIRTLPPKLQIACMNYGLARDSSAALLRLAGGEVRAVLSDRYAAADDEMLLDMVSDCLDRTGYRADALVRAAAVGPHTLMRITLPGEGKAVRVGDVIEHGIDIGNSELGLRSVQLTPVTYRLVCTNGMRSWRSEAGVRLRHIGDPSRLHEQLRDAIPVAFAEARGDIERWQRAVDVLLDSALEENRGAPRLRADQLGDADGRTHAGGGAAPVAGARIRPKPAGRAEDRGVGLRRRERHHGRGARAPDGRPARDGGGRPPLPRPADRMTARANCCGMAMRRVDSLFVCRSPSCGRLMTAIELEAHASTVRCERCGLALRSTEIELREARQHCYALDIAPGGELVLVWSRPAELQPALACSACGHLGVAPEGDHVPRAVVEPLTGPRPPRRSPRGSSFAGGPRRWRRHAVGRRCHPTASEFS